MNRYKAALEGNATAMARLGAMLIEGGEGLKSDHRGALKLLVRAEALGMDTADAMRAASAKLGDRRAEAIRRGAKEGPLPAPRIDAGTPGVECW